MFFQKKNQQEIYQRLENRLQKLDQTVTAALNQPADLNQALARLEQIDSRTETISQNIHRLQTAVQKQDMAIEDLLDGWEEKESETDRIKKYFLEAEQKEKLFLQLLKRMKNSFSH